MPVSNMAKDFRRWVYHETEQPKIIHDSEFEQYESEGWKSTPAAFLTYDDVGIDKDAAIEGDMGEIMKGQQVKDAIDGVSEAVNGMLNLEIMTKVQLVEFAEKHLPGKVKKSLSKQAMINKIKELYEA